MLSSRSLPQHCGQISERSAGHARLALRLSQMEQVTLLL
jgi:hypothetical protein